MQTYEESYVGQIRRLAGKRKLIMTGARGVVRDPQGRILLIRRRDNGRWAMPAGSQELGESILDCLKREVKEETGLDVLSATPIAIYSNLSIVTAYDDPYQLLLVEFLVDEWSASPVTATDETVAACFFHMDAPPKELADHYDEVLEDLRSYDGQLILK